MKRILAVVVASALIFSAPFVFAQSVAVPPGSTAVTQTATLNDAAQIVAHSHTHNATLTLTSSPGMYVYVTGLDISNCEGAAVAAASPTYITTTGLNGSPQFQVGSGPATAGTCSPTQTFAFAKPLKAQAQGTNVTFVLPTFIVNQAVSVNVYYFVAQ